VVSRKREQILIGTRQRQVVGAHAVVVDGDVGNLNARASPVGGREWQPQSGVSGPATFWFELSFRASRLTEETKVYSPATPKCLLGLSENPRAVVHIDDAWLQGVRDEGIEIAVAVEIA
jgi:hypothetical protein